MHQIAVYPQATGQNLGMQVVLFQRVLETVPLFIQHLRPVTIAGSAEYPAVFIHRFDHENAVPGNDYMVYPGRPEAGIYRYVVEYMIFTQVQEKRAALFGL